MHINSYTYKCMSFTMNRSYYSVIIEFILTAKTTICLLTINRYEYKVIMLIILATENNKLCERRFLHKNHGGHLTQRPVYDKELIKNTKITTKSKFIVYIPKRVVFSEI